MHTESSFPHRRAVVAVLLWMLPLAPERLAGQTDSVTIAAGERYRASGVQAWLLGRDYRDLWTAPIRVPVLDLSTYAGGLTPVKRGSGLQTRSLRFVAPDGREYNFRSVDKDQSGGLHPDFRGTLVGRIAQDQVSSKHPTGALIAGPLLDAAGVMHPGPRLFVMPDDPRLGEFGELFGGMLGTLEIHPDEGEGDARLFRGAARVAGTDRLLEHLEESPADRVDARAYLRARLMDLLMGDWDRHVGQWRWARYDSAGISRWLPVPEDRDNAFSSYDGLLLDVARTRAPRLVEFGRSYSDLFGMTENAQALDRELLSELPAEAFEEAAADLRTRLTDAVITRAVASTPPAYTALRGAEIEAALRARRDALPAAARAFYAQLAREVEILATDEDELAAIQRLPDGSVAVSIALLGTGGDGVRPAAPYFERTLHPSETREVRIYLRGGDDRAIVRGGGAGDLLVRVIGGGGNDVLSDSSSTSAGVTTAFYDHRGDNTFVTTDGTVVDRREFTPPDEGVSGFNENAPAYRDRGSEVSWFQPWAEWRYNIGPVVGAGPRWTRYGFRRAPYAHSVGARLLYAPLENRWGVEATGDYRRTNSPSRTTFSAYATQLAITRFHGYGNDTGGAGSPELYKVPELTVGIEPLYHRAMGGGGEVFIGPIARYTRPELEPIGPAADLRPLGTEPFWRLGGQAGAVLDTRDLETYPRGGLTARLVGSGFAPFGDLPGAFGRVDATAAAYLPVPLPLETTLAVRAGGRRAWGVLPFQEAAYVGGLGSLRGHRYQRWAGDAALFGGAELRAFLTRFKLITRGDLGVIALADAGRVYVDGESPGGWHTGVGGGVWLGILDRTRTLSIVAAHGEETALYFTLGMPF